MFDDEERMRLERDDLSHMMVDYHSLTPGESGKKVVRCVKMDSRRQGSHSHRKMLIMRVEVKIFVDLSGCQGDACMMGRASDSTNIFEEN